MTMKMVWSSYRLLSIFWILGIMEHISLTSAIHIAAIPDYYRHPNLQDGPKDVKLARYGITWSYPSFTRNFSMWHNFTRGLQCYLGVDLGVNESFIDDELFRRKKDLAINPDVEGFDGLSSPKVHESIHYGKHAAIIEYFVGMLDLSFDERSLNNICHPGRSLRHLLDHDKDDRAHRGIVSLKLTTAYRNLLLDRLNEEKCDRGKDSRHRLATMTINVLSQYGITHSTTDSFRSAYFIVGNDMCERLDADHIGKSVKMGFLNGDHRLTRHVEEYVGFLNRSTLLSLSPEIKNLVNQHLREQRFIAFLLEKLISHYRIFLSYIAKKIVDLKFAVVEDERIWGTHYSDANLFYLDRYILNHKTAMLHFVEDYLDRRNAFLDSVACLEKFLHEKVLPEVKPGILASVFFYIRHSILDLDRKAFFSPRQRWQIHWEPHTRDLAQGVVMVALKELCGESGPGSSNAGQGSGGNLGSNLGSSNHWCRPDADLEQDLCINVLMHRDTQGTHHSLVCTFRTDGSAFQERDDGFIDRKISGRFVKEFLTGENVCKGSFAGRIDQISDSLFSCYSEKEVDHLKRQWGPVLWREEAEVLLAATEDCDKLMDNRTPAASTPIETGTSDTTAGETDTKVAKSIERNLAQSQCESYINPHSWLGHMRIGTQSKEESAIAESNFLSCSRSTVSDVESFMRSRCDVELDEGGYCFSEFGVDQWVQGGDLRTISTVPITDEKVLQGSRMIQNSFATFDGLCQSPILQVVSALSREVRYAFFEDVQLFSSGLADSSRIIADDSGISPGGRVESKCDNHIHSEYGGFWMHFDRIRRDAGEGKARYRFLHHLLRAIAENSYHLWTTGIKRKSVDLMASTGRDALDRGLLPLTRQAHIERNRIRSKYWKEKRLQHERKDSEESKAKNGIPELKRVLPKYAILPENEMPTIDLRIVEIGCWTGDTTTFLLKHFIDQSLLTESGRKVPIRLHIACVDPFEHVDEEHWRRTTPDAAGKETPVLGQSAVTLLNKINKHLEAAMVERFGHESSNLCIALGAIIGRLRRRYWNELP